MMVEKQIQETVDKYRTEINKPTTGGVIGYSVRAINADKTKSVNEAIEMAIEVSKGINAKLINI